VARFRLLIAALLVAALSGSAAPPRQTLTHDAYVWQRRWTPALADALGGAADLVRAWRVLAAETDDAGRLIAMPIDRAALAASGRPVVLVVRLDGQSPRWDTTALRADVAALVAAWRGAAVPVVGLEIDHDGATARLAAYARFLAALRAMLPVAWRLSITALPAWLDAPALADVLAPLDEAVLQVHAVADPRTGLLAPRQALRWAAAFDRRTPVAFRIALPTYGSRVAWNADGRILAVESEIPRLVAGDRAAELIAAPRDVAALLRTLETAGLRHLAGIAWFRLPTDDDRRGWSPATWRAVVAGRTPQPRIEAVIEAGAQPALRTLVLANTGDADGTLPAAIALPRDCRAADGIGAYRLERGIGGLTLRRTRDGLLRSRQALPVGWLRCAGDRIAVRLEP
jgi:hypothetical protein